MHDEHEWDVSTIAIRTGHQRTAESEHSEPIYPTSSFLFDTAAEAAARFSGDKPGNVYSRFTNPTVKTFEARLAAMEGGDSCVATASGMAAIFATCMGLLEQGDHIVSSRAIFGSTVMLFNKYLSRCGITTSYAELSGLDSWKAAITPETRMLFLETPSNPLTEAGDIEALAQLAHDNDAILVVDNCFCTPVVQQPLKLGADIVVHSATKYIDGQGRCVGGAVVGDSKRVGEEVFGVLRTVGPTMSPFNAWVFLKGLETLELRMQRHCDNAASLATWLEQQDAVEQVYFPGLESHRQFALIQKQQRMPGGIVSFRLKGGREKAWQLIDSVTLMSITANLGDAKSTITHPATTTHARLTPEEKEVAGIADGLVRISVGLENVDDLLADLERAFSGL
ncbi:O-succinylhomoserine sulfhydrylase [Solemya elarraichensis gill symbiont]|uniref:O-succinylhomoserine sulfhydrylase n=1 Tax=Solemya elarraichensis gill symbiont TaxID=1918949 RepID=A0A1T2LAJ7_9GAMM|nr:O-succinylhomoserine sulfhydrylase [Solemya elarraichensis gill symbiont]OOZ41976.1 O-succinylhomoserine sulfhydrylase [Solemya elarraichensis gill symbiont]